MIMHGPFMPRPELTAIISVRDIISFSSVFVLFCYSDSFWLIFHASYLLHKALHTSVVNKVEMHQYMVMSASIYLNSINMWPCSIFFFKDQRLFCLISPYSPRILFFFRGSLNPLDASTFPPRQRKHGLARSYSGYPLFIVPLIY
jgi:hypothetical protein